MALPSTGSVQGLPDQMGKARAESRYSAIGLINLDEEANRSAQCGKSARWVRSGGGGNRRTGWGLRDFPPEKGKKERGEPQGKGGTPPPHPKTATTPRGCF